MFELLRKFRFWLRRDRFADEMDEEMRLHLELRARANRARGVDERDAAAAARRQFGNALVLREQGRDAWGFGWLERAIQDFRYACRRLIKQRLVTIVAVLTLGLGIGANTSMFTLVDALLFRPAPAANPHELVWITTERPPSFRPQNVSYPDYRMYRDHTDIFQGVVAFSRTRASIGGASPRRVDAILVSGGYFQVLGIQPQAGRLFTERDDDVAGSSPVVVITDNLWRTHFGADPAILNRTVPINGRPFRIVGIAPRDFNGLNMVDDQPISLFLPLSMAQQLLPDRPEALTDATDNWLEVVGRLQPDVSMARASTAIAAISATAPSRVADAARAAAAGDGQPQSLRAVLNPVAGGIGPGERGELQPVLMLLLVVPALVLLVAASNVGNLMLSSGLARRTELSLRRALGATRGRLVRQLLAESVVLAVLAGIAAALIGIALIRMIGALGDVPPIVIAALRPDARVLAATMVVGLLSILIFGLFPALSATSRALAPTLKDEGTSTTSGSRRRLRSAFVIAQVAVSLTLLITAGLFVQSLAKALKVDPGFDPRHKVVASYDLALQGYSEARRESFNRELLDRVRALPDVQSAALASTLPLGGEMWGNGVRSEGMREDDSRISYFAAISDGYFETLGIPIVLGRAISEDDRAASANVVVVNEALARDLWPDANPIGQRLKMEGESEPWREVVGVARDVKHDQLTERPRRFLYLPETQWERPTPMSLVVASTAETSAILAAITETSRSLDPDLPLYRLTTIEERLAHTVDLQRAASALLGVFGVLALLLAAIGLYGVAAHSVTLRTKEIGIRMSLGARASQVLRMVIGDGMRLTSIGVVVGVLLSLAVSQVLASFLFGLRATDTMTFLAAGIALCLVAMLACYVPARRASRVDPLRALRHE
jgi:predicted permease